MFEKSKNVDITMSVFVVGVSKWPYLLTSTLLAFANKAAKRNLDTFQQ